YVITNINNIYEKSLNIVNFNMPNGFVINNYVYITEAELFKKSMSTAYKSKFKYGSKIRDINKLRIGDYVVHINHGIGKYLGIVTLTSNGLKKDYIYLQYKNNDKLYIPVEKIELISKYSSNEGIMPGLSKLGGTEWEKQKLRVKGKVKDIAKELLDLSIKRSSQVGFSFIKDDDEQIKFESDFIYAETKDQLTATNDIKKDMESIHPMDRLLCGDVGYGKTEVAFRAIFKAIKSGKQVAYLCPTTILSKQHYENALQRFFGFGINIEVLNRFVSDKKKKEVLKNLANGQIDLIIGTHRLLSKDIVYKDLGLLVIDEEQRFGVTHKEKIKSYKANIDVLTLSATPIPRTLQMSLTGIRGLSLIETPPVDRYPIQTYVLRENDQVIKDAIYKELSRNGQVFILNNRVSKMDSEISRIKKLVPEALVSCIHGQMNKSQIEETMERFVSKEYDVLICTTIIETGIDIQNANTLIVIDADCFGLSQLYQIRGRIGRGQKIGYAYLMYNKNKELSEIAVKRLSAIKEFTELGSGYALAVRDLSIRGAGDVLGMEQSGFIDTIGYDMYIKILNEEVSKLKGENVIEENTSEEKPFIQVATHIDDNYAPNEEVKIDLHKKINTIKNYADFNSVKEEIKDRFGKVDEALIVYMLEELFQALAPLKGVEKVEQKDKIITVVFSKEKSAVIDGHKLLINLFNITPNFGISYLKDKIQITLKTNNLDKHFMYYIIEMIEKIA
ncbi:MAG: transcription-repair coupling factor, partial [Bacilli bacterium]